MNDESKQEATVSQSKPSGRARSAQTARLLIRRTKQASRRKFPAEEKIRILLEGIRGEVGVSELCRREGIHPTIYYKWSIFLFPWNAPVKTDGIGRVGP